MKAKRLLAILLALCLLVSAMPMSFMTATAASGTLGEGRITYYDNLREYVTNPTSTLGNAANLFDGSLNTKAEGGWPGSVTYTFELTEAKTIYAYTMGTHDDGSWKNRQPTAWTLYGSTDGVDYVPLDVRSGVKVHNENHVYYDEDFRIANPTAYQYYKMEVTAYANGGHYQCAEIVLSGYDTTALIAVEGMIAALNVDDADFAADVAAARAAYDALGAVKASVNNYADLLESESIVILQGADDPEKVTAAIDKIDAIGAVTYKSKAAIEAAEAAWNALTDADKEALAVYGDILTAARSAFDALVNAYSVTFTSEVNIGSIPWSLNFSADEVAASRLAMADEAKYQYQNGVNIGIQPGSSKGTSKWGVGTQMESQPNDNAWNPWNHSNRFMTLVVVPFSGMAFTYDTYLFRNYDYGEPIPMGNAFVMNGKTYQVFNKYYRYYDYKAYENNGSVTDSRVSVYPGSGDYASVIGNVFNYVYANYAQTNKWDDMTLGIPSANAGKSGDETYYQAFEGPDGKAYILAYGTDLATVTLGTSDAGYEAQVKAAAEKVAIVTGELAAAIAVEADLFTKAGDLVSISETAVVFENGTLTADGFVESDSAAAARVQALIDALPAAADVQASDEDVIENVRAEYDAISVAAQAMVDTAKLTAAEAALDEILNGPAEAVALVQDIAAIGTVTYKSKTLLADLRARYAAMDAATQAYVTNVADLEVAEAALQAVYDAADITFNTYSGKTFSITPWMNNGVISDANLAATATAWANSIKFYYTERQYNVGNQPDRNWISGTRTMGDLRGAPGAEIDISNSAYTDNIGNPWNHGNRYMAFINSPFSGTAFIYTEYFAAVGKGDYWNQPALSESFTVGDKVYQIGWNFLLSRDANGTNVSRDNSVYPGSGIDNNTFRYAVAMNAYAEKVSGDIYGYPAAAAVKSGDTTYQKYISENGSIYLMSSSAMIDSVTAAQNSAEYEAQLAAAAPYVIEGDLADAVAANEAALANLGALVSVSDTEITFANGEITADGVTYYPANYDAYLAAMMKMPNNLSYYTEESRNAVYAISDNVKWDLYAYEQAAVDAWAAALEEAVANLELQPEVAAALNITITNSEGIVVAADAAGKYNITWNANVVLDEEATIAAINDLVTFKEYGVIYGTSEENVQAAADAGENVTGAKILAIDSGADIDVYTIFGFRLKNVAEGADRAAMFYITYEFNGQTYTIYSECVEAAAEVVL